MTSPHHYYDHYYTEDYPEVDKRRVTIYSRHLSSMKLLDIRQNGYQPSEEKLVAWIDKYTTGKFYLSQTTIGFVDEKDLFMFKLAFKQ